MNRSTASSKMLIIIIGVLLLTNIAMLFLFVLPSGRRGHSDRDAIADSGMAPVLRNEVGFNDEQVNAYKDLRQSNRTEMKQLFKNLRKAKENFYYSIYLPGVSDSILMARADSIAISQKELDLHMYKYFENIRGIATPDQIPKYDTAIKKVLTKMIGRQGRDRSQKSKK